MKMGPRLRAMAAALTATWVLIVSLLGFLIYGIAGGIFLIACIFSIWQAIQQVKVILIQIRPDILDGIGVLSVFLVVSVAGLVALIALGVWWKSVYDRAKQDLEAAERTRERAALHNERR